MSDGVRSFVARPGVGVTANVIQSCDLRLSRVHVESPALILLRHGEKTLQAGARRWTVRGGEALAVAGGQSFDVTNRLSADGRYEARWLVWDPVVVALLEPTEAGARPLAGALPLKAIDAELGVAVDRAVDAIRNVPALPDEVARHRIVEPLLWLALHGVRFAAPRSRTLATRLRGLFAAAVAQTWTAADVAERLAMSEATLRRKLSAEGTPFGALLADVRMSFALTLLQSTEHSVARIASDVGYASASRFALRFRQRFGFAPSAIRGHRREPQPARFHKRRAIQA